MWNRNVPKLFLLTEGTTFFKKRKTTEKIMDEDTVQSIFREKRKFILHLWYSILSKFISIKLICCMQKLGWASKYFLAYFGKLTCCIFFLALVNIGQDVFPLLRLKYRYTDLYTWDLASYFKLVFYRASKFPFQQQFYPVYLIWILMYYT